MPAVAASRLRRVVNLSPLDGRSVFRRSAVQRRELPAEPGRVVIVLAGAEGAREDLRPRLRVEHMIDSRRRAVVEVRRRRPDAVERWGLVAVGHARLDRLAVGPNLLSEPAVVEPLEDGFPVTVDQPTVGADGLEVNDAVRI